MSTSTRLMFVIADAEHARFVSPAADNALHTVGAIDSLEAHKQSADIGSDRPGAAMHTGASARHSFTPRHDPHDLEKRNFARFIAGEICARAGRDEFDSLVIVAPAHSLGEIREHLDGDTASRIIGTAHKDLVKTPDSELWPHLREWVPPVHRVPPYSNPSG